MFDFKSIPLQLLWLDFARSKFPLTIVIVFPQTYSRKIAYCHIEE